MMTSNFKRPKLKIPKTKSEWVWDIIGLSFYFFTIILIIVVWGDLPDKVPAHYNAMGEVDRWGSKGLLIVLPILGVLIFGMMQAFEKIPWTHNYPERLNEENAPQFYLNSRKMINQLKNICLISFSLISIESISIPLDWGFRFGMWFLPLFLIGMTLPIVIGLIRQRKIQ